MVPAVMVVTERTAVPVRLVRTVRRAVVLFLLLLILIGVHGMYYGPRVARASELADGGDEDASWRLENLRRTSLLLSLALLLVTVAVLASGVILGNHEYSYIAAG